MLKRLIERLKEKKTHRLLGESRVLEVVQRAQHNISRQLIDTNALKVLYRLKNRGFQAFLVGGGVRDLLLEKNPKDFDIVTDAYPEQVRALFGNSRLIGRRFKLVHVVFGREIIEVATFRSTPDQNSQHHNQSATGMLIRDNVYGNKDQDALRRDFTVNALYYDIKDFSLHSYCQGLQDLKQRKLRLIGDPELRYREDPVRMLRAARFQAKLNFQLDAPSKDWIPKLAHLLKEVAAARLFEESLKLFTTGHGYASYQALKCLNLVEYLFPQTTQALDAQPRWEPFIQQLLTNTDERLATAKPVNPAFLYAAILWPPIKDLQQKLSTNITSLPAAQHQAESIVLQKQQKVTTIPKRLVCTIKEIWDLQPALIDREPKKAETLITHPKFRAGYDFILLREQAGEDLKGSGQWWTRFLAENSKAVALFSKRYSHHESKNLITSKFNANSTQSTPVSKNTESHKRRKRSHKIRNHYNNE